MKDKNTDKFDELRQKSEQMLSRRTEARRGSAAVKTEKENDDVLDLIHELHIHQTELELQNEELRRARVELETLHREYKDLYEFAPCAYIALNSNKIIDRINLRGVMLLGTDRNPAQRTPFSRFIAPGSESAYYTALERASGEGERQSLELELRPRGKPGPCWVQADVTAVKNDEGALENWRLALIDISGSKNLEEKLQTALKEKTHLMHELNHRVKNNLIMVNSLISLKESELEGNADLSDLRHQIDAVKIVHEKLYQTDEVGKVNGAEYLTDLLRSVFSIGKKAIKIEDRLEPFFIDTRRAVPLGLLTNEIATNAVKHGFPDGGPNKKACFTVESKRENGMLVLSLSNNGTPLPDDFDIDNGETLGMWLINSLTEQLSGTLAVEGDPHPRFTVRFPAGTDDSV